MPLVGRRPEPLSDRAEGEFNVVADRSGERVAECFERFAVRGLILRQLRALDFEPAPLLVQLLRAGEVLVTVNVFCDDVEVDVFTCGDFAQDAATEDEVRRAISLYAAELYA